MWQKINSCYPPWLEFIAPFLLWAAFAYTYSIYPDLPARFPTHFGMSGIPDAWQPKSFGPVYMGLLIGALVWLSVLLTNLFLIIKPDDPAKVVNIPQSQKEKLGPARLEAIRRTAARGLVLINVTTIAMITTMHYQSIKTALGLQNNLGYLMHIFIAAILIESLWLTVKTISMTSVPKLKH